MSLRKDVTGDIAKHVTPRVTQNKSLPVSNFFLLVNGFLLNGCRKYFSEWRFIHFFDPFFLSSIFSTNLVRFLVKAEQTDEA